MKASDVARWAFWVPFRGALSPQKPEHIAALSRLWPVQRSLARRQAEAMKKELQACFGSASRQDVSDAYRMALRCHMEELLLGKLDRESWKKHMRFEGREHLDAALERGRGALILFPHAGNFMMMIASVSLAGYPYTQYAARGMPPEEMAKDNPELLGHSWFLRSARQSREDNEDKLPANFISLDTPVRHLYRCLERNEVVGIAFDGRIGKRFVPVNYFGRTALINPGPYRLAQSTQAAIVPTFCSVPKSGPNVCHFAPPILPDETSSPSSLMEAYLHGAVEPWIRAHRSEYALWLAHCRLRAGVDDHPFFIDTAPDDRYKVHL